jgi:hypothetical protein
MHGGLFIQVRQSIQYARYAKPWQQALLTAVLILGGVALIALGDFIGLAPAALGFLFIRPTIRNQLRSRRPGRRKQSG